VYTEAMIWTLFFSKKNSTSMNDAVASNRETALKGPPAGVEDGVAVGAEEDPEEDERREEEEPADLAAALALMGTRGHRVG
jgi:hypothetical protein